MVCYAMERAAGGGFGIGATYVSVMCIIVLHIVIYYLRVFSLLFLTFASMVFLTAFGSTVLLTTFGSTVLLSSLCEDCPL